MPDGYGVVTLRGTICVLLSPLYPLRKVCVQSVPL